MMLKKSFTLVELLVVIAIITLLAGLLLPVLSKVIATANSVACLNNLRQIGIASLKYADDWGGMLPHNAYKSNDRDWGFDYWETSVINPSGTYKDWIWIWQIDPDRRYAGGSTQHWLRTRGTIFACPQGLADWSSYSLAGRHGAYYALNQYMGGYDYNAPIDKPKSKYLRSQTWWYADTATAHAKNNFQSLNANTTSFDLPYAWLRVKPGWVEPAWSSYWGNGPGPGHPGGSANFLMGDLSTHKPLTYDQYLVTIWNDVNERNRFRDPTAR